MVKRSLHMRESVGPIPAPPNLKNQSRNCGTDFFCEVDNLCITFEIKKQKSA